MVLDRAFLGRLDREIASLKERIASKKQDAASGRSNREDGCRHATDCGLSSARSDRPPCATPKGNDLADPMRGDVHRQPSEGSTRHIVLYEQYRDEAAFLEHQQTEHFKRLVLERALPILAHRERVPFNVLPW